jgi:glycosyltransferase involved in cell wall biosynthesis
VKIALIVTEFPSTTETFIMRDMIKFLEYGHDVRLYHLLPFNKKATLHDFARITVNSAHTAPFLSIPVIREAFHTFKSQSATIGQTLLDLIKTSWRNPEVLFKSLAILPKSILFARQLNDWGADHIHGEFAGHPTTSAWIISRLTGIGYSASCRAHDIFINQTLLGLTLKEASAIRTISRYNIDFLHRHVPALRNKPMTVIHSSVDLSKIIRVKRNRSKIFTILYVGSLEPRKGVDDLLHALTGFSTPNGWELHIIGDGLERKKLEKLARTLNFSGSVTFHGAKSFEHVSEAYHHCDVVIAPSRYGKKGRTEGIPNVVIEALAHERPVITTRISGIPELVEDGITGLLVSPDDRIGLTKAIEKVYQDQAGSAEMAKRGRLRVENEFNLEQNAQAQLDMFQQAFDYTRVKRN